MTHLTSEPIKARLLEDIRRRPLRHEGSPARDAAVLGDRSGPHPVHCVAGLGPARIPHLSFLDKLTLAYSKACGNVASVKFDARSVWFQWVSKEGTTTSEPP